MLEASQYFKLFYRAITIKTAWCWHENRHEDPGISIEDPDINPPIYSQLILTKESKTHDGENTASSTNVAGNTGYPY
jgi:uncharacterized protein (DUF736 family)